MLKILVSFFLGPIGLKMLQFYLEHDAVINSAICLYGIFLIASHFNYKRMMAPILESVKDDGDGKARKKKLLFSWEDLQQSSFFPFIAGPLNLIPARISQESFLKIMEKDKNWQKKAGGTTTVAFK